MAVILFAIILLGVYFAVSAAVVAKEVKTAAESVPSLSGVNLTDEGSIANLDSTVRNLDRHVGIAYANTSNPVWRMMSGMPQYGGNVAADSNASGATSGTAQTGASVLPYVAVVVLLAVAGVAFLALRKKSR